MTFAAPFLRLFVALALSVATVHTALPAIAAEAPAHATIVLKDGTELKAERFFPTYTTLVVLTPGADMKLIPNERVETINGVPYEQVYWGQEAPIYGERDVPGAEAATATDAAAPQAAPATAAAPILPVAAGSFRRYDLTGSRTTWVRRGRDMHRNADVDLVGMVRETVLGAAPEGPAALRESVVKHQPGRPAEEVQILQLIEQRPEGTFLVGYGLEQFGMGSAPGQERINVPPMLWPAELSVGKTWTVGPFKRLGLYQTGRMQVVGQESVTVPAGTFEAFKVEGFGHVFGGVANLAAGRLITDHGTITSTTWVVPGVGPVKEERKIHLHQDFFPKGQTGFETPFVVEERTTRALAEYQTGELK